MAAGASSPGTITQPTHGLGEVEARTPAAAMIASRIIARSSSSSTTLLSLLTVPG
jgi:hypothetical protein